MNPFRFYDNNAKYFKSNLLCIDWDEYTLSGNDGYIVSQNPTQTYPFPSYTVSLNNDPIEVKCGEKIDSAIVTSYIPKGIKSTIVEKDGEQIIKDTFSILSHNITFGEYDGDNNLLGKYTYSVNYPYSDMVNDDFGLTGSYFPSTKRCSHTVKNADTKHVKLSAKISIPYYFGPSDNIYTASDFYYMNAILAEKTT